MRKRVRLSQFPCCNLEGLIPDQSREEPVQLPAGDSWKVGYFFKSQPGRANGWAGHKQGQSRMAHSSQPDPSGAVRRVGTLLPPKAGCGLNGPESDL